MAQYSAVVTTGIYCRPECGAKPLRQNVRSFDLAAAAEAAGFRACLMCRPYRSSSPGYWSGNELVCRAVQLTLMGALDRGREADLARRVGVSGRHLRRLFQETVGVTPTQLAQSARAHFARRLLDDTEWTVTEIAFAAGFGSVRQLNRSFLQIFRAPPLELRRRRRKSDRLVADGGLLLRLPFSGPLDWRLMTGFLGQRAIPGVEHVSETGYRRTIVIHGDPGVIEVMPGEPGHLMLRAHLPHWEGLIHLAQRARSIFALDFDVEEAVHQLSADPVLGDRLIAHPGLRVPGCWDPFETGVRAIIGQRVSVAAASTITGRLVERHGTAVAGLAEMGLTHTFPGPEVLAEADLGGLGLTRAREDAVRTFAAAVSDDRVRLDGSVGLQTLVEAITALPGLGAWTAHYLAMRIGEADAFPASDLGLRRAWDRFSTGQSVDEAARRWRPWRSLAAAHLWMSEGERDTMRRSLPASA